MFRLPWHIFKRYGILGGLFHLFIAGAIPIAIAATMDALGLMDTAFARSDLSMYVVFGLGLAYLLWAANRK